LELLNFGLHTVVPGRAQWISKYGSGAPVAKKHRKAAPGGYIAHLPFAMLSPFAEEFFRNPTAMGSLVPS
jgi:hypothetical protein